MDRLKSILVGVDFSPSSRRALEQGLRLARWNEARLRVFHVESDIMRSLVARDVRRDMKGMLARASAPENTELEVALGDPLDQALRIVKENEADLLVIGVYGSLGEYVSSGLGVFATQCVRHVPAKTLVVHENCRPAFKKVVACIDFTATSDTAVEQALKVALQDGGELHLLHVPAREQESESARSRMEQGIEPLRQQAPDLDVRFEVADPGNPGEEIIRYVRRIEADLIVIGTTGSTNLSYTLLGSTVEWVIRRVRRSVLALKPADFIPPIERW